MDNIKRVEVMNCGRYCNNLERNTICLHLHAWPSYPQNFYHTHTHTHTHKLLQRDDVVHASPNLFLELEFKNKELMTRERMIHDLQRRERELTDR